MEQKKKLIVIGITMILAFIIVLMLFNYQSTEEPVPLGELSTESDYDLKLKHAEEANKIQGDGLFAVKSGYFEADSIMTNGEIRENPRIREERDNEKLRTARVTTITEQANQAMSNLESQAYGDDWDEERVVRPIAKTKIRAKETSTTEKSGKATPVTYNQVEEKRQRKQAMEDSFDQYNQSETLDCVVYRTQEVGSGQQVALRVTNTSILGGLTIPKNTIVFARVSFNSNRAMLLIGSLKIEGRGYAVNMKGYGEDGGEGVALSVSLTKQDVDRELTDNVVSEAQNLLGQVAGVGGKIVGNVVKSVSRSAQRETARKITLIDKQKITFIPEY